MQGGERGERVAGRYPHVSLHDIGARQAPNELGTDRYQDVLETHTRLLRDAFKDGGVEVRVDVTRCFVRLRRRCAGCPRRCRCPARPRGSDIPDGATVRVRMGMHTGEGRPASVEAGADYVGIDVTAPLASLQRVTVGRFF